MRGGRIVWCVLAAGVLVALGLAMAQPQLPKEGGEKEAAKPDLRMFLETFPRMFGGNLETRFTTAPFERQRAAIPCALQVVDGAVFVVYDHYLYKLDAKDLSLLAKVDMDKLLTDDERAAAEERAAMEEAERQAREAQMRAVLGGRREAVPGKPAPEVPGAPKVEKAPEQR